ncbi:symmetrical bis(5'-nucleosyl)-tetraphosphatase [Candidatus Synchoanobacter obligatus]|uniref:Symmetrical bis(5'-nucleosyl)-tetraphosphatase n=1 Tax=Candidatus Synchoanobacter obligatus TaxID=2919597 RepID=A0ABT1L4R5_9GAMM|nr:symmetrical bis(5'-nucleosyl)-tetraphosphatase [Candidatus Synchoanobacter obligatus]MCP8352151.1 symmetrical bis(5'-nucleosyl)-tetraphosphatase [Candidatus Synchoanobacter obligatus]
MSRSIIVGDIHGCFFTLQALLKQLSFDASSDCLYCLGDLIGKGRFNEEVLSFFASLPNKKMVLGNHEISWLRSYIGMSPEREDLLALSRSPKSADWFDFLKQQPFLIQKDFGFLVHASIAPEWQSSEALALSGWLSEALSSQPEFFFQKAHAPDVLRWDPQLPEEDKRFLALQIFTRCRYYQENGVLALDNTGPPEANLQLVPWYMKPRLISETVWFGHWASLKGRALERDIHLDGGAVYGGDLIAIDANSRQCWRQKRVVEDE